jgi:hypothetical protein
MRLLTRSRDVDAGLRPGSQRLSREEIRRADAQWEPSDGHTGRTMITVIGSPDAPTDLAFDLKVHDQRVAEVHFDGVDHRETSAAVEFAGAITHVASPVPAPWRLTVDETANAQPGGCAREAV